MHTYTHNTNIQTNLSIWDAEERVLLKDYAALAQVPNCNVQGSRAPYLQPNDAYYTNLQNLGIRFDSSMTYSSNITKKAYWPFTLDYGVPIASMCSYFGSCPTKAFPGLWEVPMTEFDYSNKGNCMDPIYDNFDQYMALLKQNFLDTYKSNKVPRGFYWHWRYFSTDNNFGILNPSNPINATRVKLFTDFYTWLVTTFPDIIFATERQVLDWMKNPVDLATTKTLSMFKSCPNLNFNPGNVCANGKISCLYPGLDQIDVCGTQCPSIYPQKGANWIFPNGYQNYLGQCKNSSTNTANTTNTTNTALGNAKQATWKGTVTAKWYEGTGNSSNPGVGGYFCATFSVKNLHTNKTAKGFIINFYACPKLAKMTNLWGYSTVNTLSGFQMMGSGISISPTKTISIGGWCMDVNTDGNNVFRFNTHLRFGVDLYSEAPKCVLPKCRMWCGNGVCDKGETSTYCPIDCKKLVCPSRRFLNLLSNF